jgi:uncharacterized RDD family membrane protein YckC
VSQAALRENPYAPPQSPVGERALPPAPDQIATRGQRFANYLIDYAVSMLVGIVLLGGLAVLDPTLLAEGDRLWDELLLGALLTLVYYLPCEALTGRTPAKLITGTRVVDAGGSPASTGQILARTLTRLVPFEAFSFLGSRSRPVGWHDSWSGTLVVRTRGALPLTDRPLAGAATFPRSAE